MKYRYFKFMVLFFVFVIISGCKQGEVSEDIKPSEEKNNQLMATSCQKRLHGFEDLSCREMFNNSKYAILKYHELSGRDKVKLVNLVSDRALELPDCKIKGWSIVDSEALIICYLHESNVASGRDLIASEKLNHIFIDLDTMNISNIGELPFSAGLDIELIKVDSNNAHVFCHESSCFVFDSKINSPYYLGIFEMPEEYIREVIEIEEGVLGVSSYRDGNFYLSRIDNGVEQSREKTFNGYDLSFDGIKLSLKPIKTIDDKLQALIYDYKRFDANSGLTWGETNTEGRVAWGAYYYWTALSYIASMTDNLELTNDIQERIEQELNLTFSEGLSLEQMIGSKRYSMNRTRAMFMLHVARMITALDTIESSFNLNISSYRNTLEQSLNENIFNEGYFSSRKLQDPDYWGEQEINAGWFYFKRGVDFWADGLPIPFNYVSAICTNSYKNIVLTSQCNQALEYHKAEVKSFNGGKWRYWPGQLANNGYSESDDISDNTPSWEGNKNLIAHDSYLSMDSIALLNSNSANYYSELFSKMILEGKIQADVIPHLSEKDRLLLCGKDYLDEILGESFIGGYDGYKIYLSVSKLTLLKFCM